MSTEDSDDGVDDSEIVRPSLTVQNRQMKLLDDLCDGRYGSRSEAVRAAIESHAQSVLSDGETGIERIHKQVTQLRSQIDDLSEQVEELQERMAVGHATNPASLQDENPDPHQDVPTVESVESRGSAGLQNKVYTVLSEEGSMSIWDIADHVGEEPLVVHESLTKLVEEYDYLMRTEHTDPPQYEIKEPTPN